MESGLTTYLDFAENDYHFFRATYDSGNKGGALAALGQNICERYIKHIISEYAQPECDSEMSKKEKVLKTHSLHRLLNYCITDMGLDIPDDTAAALERIDGYYFTTRYPGEDSFIPTERDVEKANAAVEKSRKYTLQLCREMEYEAE